MKAVLGKVIKGCFSGTRMRARDAGTVEEFHKIYYNGVGEGGHLYDRTYWMGTPCLKCPLDMWVYQEMIAELRPDLILETGTHSGGSALFMAHMLDIIGHGEVVSIDIEPATKLPSHPRITYVKGSSSDAALVAEIMANRSPKSTLVVLDSDHSKKHVAEELKLFAPLVSVGSYIIVEDTNINGHPVFDSFGEGPFEAVEEFLATDPRFIVDGSREKFLMTFNPRGYLKRTR